MKNSTKKILVIIACCAVLLIAAGVCFSLYYQHREQKEAERRSFLFEEAMARVIRTVEDGSYGEIVFDEETQLAMEYYDVSSFFSETEVREVVANRFARLNPASDPDGLLELLTFLNENRAVLLAEGEVYDICFTQAYISALKEHISSNGIYEKTENESEIYTYNNSEFWFASFGCYVKNDFFSTILVSPEYRKDQHEQYDESSPGYFLVGETVELIEDVMESSEAIANKFYPPATCPKCGGSFRANTHRARMIAKHGYCGMGLCGKN